MDNLSLNTLDLSTKYGKQGKSIFNLIRKYESKDIKSKDEEKFLIDLKFIIDSDIYFNDKLIVISSIINNSQNLNELLF